MTLLRFHPLPFPVHPSTSHGCPTLHRLRFKPIAFASSSSFGTTPARIPARDRVIDFGKHRGKMLGTLPSSYLTWVSKNLRARDYEEWAKLADEVLRDPVYRDRLEWETAERVLTGVGLRPSSISDSPVEELLDISERFGWDNEDKDGWSRVDLQLLGTSKGGRIPRRLTSTGGGALGGQKGFQMKPRGHGGVKKVAVFGTDLGAPGGRRAMGSPGNAVRWERSTKLLSPRKSLGSQSHGGSTESRSSAPEDGKDDFIGMPDSSEKSVLPDKDCWVHEAKQSKTPTGRKVGFLSKAFQFAVEEEEISPEESVKEKMEERRERRRLKREQEVRMLRREVVADGGGGDTAVRSRQIGQSDGGGYANPFPGRGALLDRIKGGEAT